MEGHFGMIPSYFREDNPNDDCIIPPYAAGSSNFYFNNDPFCQASQMADLEMNFQENSSFIGQDNYFDNVDDDIFMVTLRQDVRNQQQQQIVSENPKFSEIEFLQNLNDKIQLNENENECKSSVVNECKNFAVFTPSSGQFDSLMNYGDDACCSDGKSFHSKLKEEENTVYRRKFKPDDMRKKIKVHFHKTLRMKINQKLREAGSKKFFNALNQNFICNISKAYNQEVLNKSLNEIYSIKFPCRRVSDHSKFQQNNDTLDYIQDNSDIEKNSGYDVIGKLTYRQLFEEYLKSEEYGQSLDEISKKEKGFYLDRYRELARDYIEFFERDKE